MMRFFFFIICRSETQIDTLNKLFYFNFAGNVSLH